MKSKLLLLLFLIFNNSFAQLQYEDLLKLTSQEFNQEKVYLQFDKNYYSAGDDVWIKGFVFNGYQLSTISKKLYIELLDQNLQVRDKQVLLLSNGNTDTTLTLSKNLSENIYYIRAYTDLTSNTLHEKKSIYPIRIYKPNSTEQIVKRISNDFDAKVFVEGGKGFVDKNSKYVVRIFNQFDSDFKWKAEVYTKENEVVTPVNVLDENLGTFQLKPIKGQFYSIKITSENGKEKIVPLVGIYNEGVSLDFLYNDSGVKYVIKSNNSEEDLKGYKIVATHNNKIIYTAGINSNAKIINKFLEINLFDKRSGIVTFSLFDRNQVKINERLVFLKNSYDAINFAFPIEKALSSDKRGLNEIYLPENSNNAYFLSVKNGENLYNDNLLSAMWYSLDFESQILNAKKYFNKEKNADLLDALLITEKWERFSTIPDPKHDDVDLKYIGKLTHKNQPLGNVMLNLFLQKNNTNVAILQKTVNANGEFILDEMNFDGELKIVYEINNISRLKLDKKELNVVLEPTIKFTPYKKLLPATGYVVAQNLEADQERTLLIKDLLLQQQEKEDFDENTIKLKEVLIKKSLATKTEELNKKLSRGMFNSPVNEKTFDFVNDPVNQSRFFSLENWLLSAVPGVTIGYVNGDLKAFRRQSVMRIFLDEIEVQSLSNLVNRDNVAMIKIFPDTSLLGNAIAIYTKFGDENIEESEKEGQKISPIIKGYSIAKEYLSTEDYENNYLNIQSDTRPTLLWKTINGITKENKTIQYFSNDKNEKNILEIIGFDDRGNIHYYSE